MIARSTAVPPRRIVFAGLTLVALTGCGLAATAAATHASASGSGSGSGSGSSASPNAPAPPVPPAGAKKPGGTGPAAPPSNGPKHVMIDGTVLGSTSSTLTVRDRDGFSRTIDTSSSTKYRKGKSTISRDSLGKGTHVLAIGSVDTDKTSLDASQVDVVTGPAGPPGPGLPAPGPAGPAAPPARPGSHGSGRAPGSGSGSGSGTGAPSAPTPPSGAPSGAPKPPASAPSNAPHPGTRPTQPAQQGTQSSSAS